MTAAIKPANKKSGFFSVRLKSKFSEDKKLFITNLVFQLLCLPLAAGLFLKEFYYSEHDINYNDSEFAPFFLIAIFAFILSLVMGFVIPMFNFRYLYNKSLVDMNYSLPLNNRQRFFADYFSGLIVYIAPFIIGIAIAFAEMFIGSLFIDLRAVMSCLSGILRVLSIVLTGMIMQYTLSVFAITFAGSTFEALFSIAAVNIMIPSFISLTWMNIVNAAHFGLHYDSITANYTLFATSPIGAATFLFSYMVKGVLYTPEAFIRDSIYSSSTLYSMFFHFTARALLFIALVVIITYILYKHRKAEDVSKPYVYNAFYYIIMSLVLYCIFSLMEMATDSNVIVSSLIICGILWFVMEVIRRRGFKRFWTAVISFAAASAAVIGVITAINATNGLGIAKIVPSASSVTDVEISVWGGYFGSLGRNQVYQNKNVINDAIKLNKELVDRHSDPDKYEYTIFATNYPDDPEEIQEKYCLDEQTVKIIYYTKNGSAIIRQYTVPTEMLADLACDIFSSREYAERTANNLYKHSLFYTKNNKSAEYCSFGITDKLGNSQDIELSLDEGKALVEAVRSDIIAMTPDDIRTSEFICKLESVTVTSSFSNTIGFFKEHNIKYQKSAADLIKELDNNQSLTIYKDPTYVFPLLLFNDVNFENLTDLNYIRNDYDYSTGLIKLDKIVSFDMNRDRTYTDYSKKWHFALDDPEAFEEMIGIATPIVVNEKVIAELQFKNATLYITDRPGNREIFDKAYKSFNIYNNQTGEPMPEELYW